MDLITRLGAQLNQLEGKHRLMDYKLEYEAISIRSISETEVEKLVRYSSGYFHLLQITDTLNILNELAAYLGMFT